MSGEDSFARFEEVLREQGPQAAFDLLALRFREDKSYPQLFEARLMRTRHELGLPLIEGDGTPAMPEEMRKRYDQAFMDAAREVGGLFLSDGQIDRAWPYYRAVGETAPVRDAIAALPDDQASDPVLEVALGERVHPLKGFQMILGAHGLCRAITFYHQYPDRNTRPDCLRLLVTTLYRELTVNLKRAIERVEGSEPAVSGATELIAGRDWLFGEHNYYVDSSHLSEVVRFSADSEDPTVLRLAVELAAYGTHLAPMFHYRGDPPFEEIYQDHLVYLRALLGEDTDLAVAHFRRKVDECDVERAGTAPAQVLVTLLARLKRYAEAIDVSAAHLNGVSRAQLVCPSVFELCQMTGDYARMQEIARGQGDLLNFAAGALHSGPGVKR